MLSLSVIFHGLVIISYFAVAESSALGGSAMGEGENGINIGLGLSGSYVDMANQLLAADVPADKTPPPIKEAVNTLKVKEILPKKAVAVAPALPEKAKPVKPVNKVPENAASVAKKMPEVAKQGSYKLTEKTPLAKPTKVQNSIDATTENKTEEAEQATITQPQKTPSKASILGTGSGSTKSAGGFKGSNQDYFTHLMAWLNQYKRYPIDAKKLKQQGIVQLQFTLNPMGKILAKSIKKSSGYSLLDQSALTMLTQAEPLPAPPEQLQRERLTLVIPINFSLITNH